MAILRGQKKLPQQLPANFFWLSLLCHLLFLLMIYYGSHGLPPAKPEPSYYYYVPSYMYSQSANFSASRADSSQNDTREKTEKFQFTDMLVKNSQDYQLTRFKAQHSYSDLFNNTGTITQSNNSNQYSEPIHLVGEKLLDDPFRKLLGRAITAHLYYSEVARRLNMRGIVSIGFMLHPSGAITEVRIVKKSREHVLDMAALNAVTAAAPINNVDIYLKQPKYLLINIIF